MDAAVRRLTIACLAALLAVAAPAAAPQPAPSREAALDALKAPDAGERQRAVVRLAHVGRMDDVPALLAALRDVDEDVRAIAEQAIWIVWSRSGDPEADRLFGQGIDEMNAGRLEAGIATFGRVIRRAPGFAEGWNKRATLYFLAGDYEKSLQDCDEVMKRNPYHFGALAGYGQIYLQLRKYEQALDYFKRALAVNPNMAGVELQVRLLEQALGSRQKPI